jgi:threonine/homoserine/homoserine lactone efflux protein
MSLALGQFVTVWAFLAVNIMSPGPNVINTIATAMGSGRRAGMGSAAGVGLGIGVWCLSMSLGISALFALWPAAQTVMTLVAIALLATFSWRYLRNAWAGFRWRRDTALAESHGMTFAAGFRRSLLINALNPKALTSWLAILSLFPVAQAGPADLAILTIGACCLSLSIHTMYVLVFSSKPASRFYLRYGWLITGAAGAFFAAFALRLFFGLFAAG